MRILVHSRAPALFVRITSPAEQGDGRADLASQAPAEEAVLLVEDHGAVLGDGVGGALPPPALVEEQIAGPAPFPIRGGREVEEGGAVGVEGGEGAVGPVLPIGAIAIQDPCTIEGFTLGLHVINFRRSFDLCFQPKSQYHQVTFSWVEVQNRIQPSHRRTSQKNHPVSK